METALCHVERTLYVSQILYLFNRVLLCHLPLATLLVRWDASGLCDDCSFIIMASNLRQFYSQNLAMFSWRLFHSSFFGGKFNSIEIVQNFNCAIPT